MRKKSELFGYQERMVRAAFKTPMCALFLRVGAGKTVITLTLIEHLLRMNQIHKVLIVGPLRVVRKVWTDEVQEWEHLQGLQFAKMIGNATTREAAFHSPAPIHLINVENLTKLTEKHGKHWPYDMVVWDEFSAAKHQGSSRSKAMWSLMRSKILTRFIGLTGTPASNGLEDVWNLVRILDGGRRLGRYKSHFQNKYMYLPAADAYKAHAKLKMLPGSDKIVHEKIKDVCFSLPDSEYPRQDKPTHNQIMVDLTPVARKAYQEMENQYFTQLANGDFVDIATAAVASTKLLQCSSGAVYTENPRYTELHKAKLEALEELVEESSGRPLLVFYNYRFNAERILKRFKQAVQLTHDDDVIDNWNMGLIPLLIANPQGAGHGLNLQQGGSDTVWFDLTWNLEHFNQANGRLDRTGQKKQVIQHYIMGTNTMDGDVMGRLKGKASVEQALMKALQRHQ